MAARTTAEVPSLPRLQAGGARPPVRSHLTHPSMLRHVGKEGSRQRLTFFPYRVPGRVLGVTEPTRVPSPSRHLHPKLSGG